MNVFSKLAAARVALQDADIKKSGENKHLNFNYSELKDFLPSINTINKNLGLISLFDIDEKEATLTIVDSEAVEGTTEIIFRSPVAEAKLQGKPSPIQELGSQHTYMRRYLYLAAYEIAEGDSVDADLGRTLTPEEIAENVKKQVDEQLQLKESLLPIIAAKGLTLEDIEVGMGCKLDEMTLETLQQVHAKLDNTPDAN